MHDVRARRHVGAVHHVVVRHPLAALMRDARVSSRVREKIRRNASSRHDILHDVGEALRREAPVASGVRLVGHLREEEPVVGLGQWRGDGVVLAQQRREANRRVVNDADADLVGVALGGDRHGVALFRAVEAYVDGLEGASVVVVEADALDVGRVAAKDAGEVARA